MKQISHEKYTLDCPSRQLLEMLSDKWVPALIIILSEGPRRPGDLQRSLEGISKKMLRQTLKNLEIWGLVDRQDYETVPPRVEYALTDLGLKFMEPLALLCHWAAQNGDDVFSIYSKKLAAAGKLKLPEDVDGGLTAHHLPQ
ncbi:winged helix-turn-helix transcriptional regulator [Pseudovibrio ascidiaceicola]|uniref:winged helix-turn-helix transcriptional regulator n=1 Tax=Pseudovibrio ascidiaceicola TaxID=285279 RepID=UPI000D69A7E3|nr:helix-turn-helix domain-containing protein [Pseudovibrio ascidiaceicola]